MTYAAGNIILAGDFNGFCGPTASGGTANANLNDIWGTGSGDKGWGQTTVSTVSTGGIVTATNWSSLVNNISAAGSQTSTTITSRSAPTAGSLISVLSNLNTDLTNITTNRGNAAASGTTSSTWTGNIAYTSATSAQPAGWTITWIQTVTFPSADQARYFWNAGGLVRLDMSKTSTGTDKDPDWNTFVGQVGTLYISGRVNTAAQTIAGTSYTGTTRVGGTGGTETTLTTTTGWYSLTAGAAATTVFQLNDATSPYTGDYIRVTAAVDASRTVLTLTTTWVDAGYSSAGTSNNISGGTDTASPYTSFGTAPAVLCRFVPPSISYLTSSWGTPTVASGVAASTVDVNYLVIAGGGGGGGVQNSIEKGAGGGGAGGYRTGNLIAALGTAYTVTVGAGGSGGPAGQSDTNGQGANGANSVFSSITSTGGGGGGAAFGGPGGGEPGRNGKSGGSGGGAGGGGSTSGGTATSGQGNNGGVTTADPSGGAGGGGAGAGGSSTNDGNGAAGGAGTASSITGSSVTRAGGGGGGGYTDGGGANGAAGSGGGGAGGSGAGTANTGGGGGGGTGASTTGGAGGSGVVIIKIPSTNTATFSAGVTSSLSTSVAGFKIYTVTATTNSSQTVTFS
jgi:hypothetical protein